MSGNVEISCSVTAAEHSFFRGFFEGPLNVNGRAYVMRVCLPDQNEFRYEVYIEDEKVGTAGWSQKTVEIEPGKYDPDDERYGENFDAINILSFDLFISGQVLQFEAEEKKRGTYTLTIPIP